MTNTLQRVTRKLRDAPVITKFSIAYVIAILIPSLAGIAYSVVETSTTTRENVTLTSAFIAEDVFANVIESVTAGSDVVEQLARNTPIRRFLDDEFEFTAQDILAYQNEIRPILDYAVAFQGRGLLGAKIITVSRDIPEAWPYFLSEQRMMDLEWYRNFVRSDRQSTWIYPNESGIHTNFPIDSVVSEPAYTYARKIYNFQGNYLGVALADVQAARVHAQIRHPEIPDIQFALVSAQRGYSVVPDYVAESLTPEETARWLETAAALDTYESPAGYWFVSRQIPGTDLTVTVRINLRQRVREAASSRLLVAAVIIMGLIGLEIGTYVILNRIFRRLHSMTSIMNDVADGEFHHRVPVDSQDEIGQIAQDFNLLIRKIDDLVSDSVQKETLQKDTELKALQFQINPHFIYNTIDTFRMQLILSGNDELADAMADFGQMLRYNVASGSFFTDLAHELDYVQKYINVQHLRSAGSIRLSIECPKELRSARVLKFLLQPVVENSLRHGMPEGEDATITVVIGATATPDFLTISVRDDGVGISPERIRAIQAYMDAETGSALDTDGENGIGLANIAGRVRLHYSQTARMTIASDAGNGTTVTLVFPRDETEL